MSFGKFFPRLHRFPNGDNQWLTQSYDYVIVGAGSAGCVLAERLSRDGTKKVLLIEAGRQRRSLMFRMPRGAMRLFMNPEYFWSFPVRYREGDEPSEAWGYGKALGGSSTVNGTWYYRGFPKDMAVLAERGATGWDWTEIERCYKELEAYRAPGAHAGRGRSGPLAVTRCEDSSPIIKATIAAATSAGIPYLDDVNAPAASGIGYSQMTVDGNGHRVSAYDAFVRPSLDRPNLTVKSDILVLRVLVEESTASGLLLRTGGEDLVLRNPGEVLISAGVLQSPKLLQLSGIGDAALLAEHGIKLVVDNPLVGQNLSEHMLVNLSYELRGSSGTNREFRGWRLYYNVLKYVFSGKGPMAFNVPELSAMVSSTGQNDWPDMQLGFSPFSMATKSKGRKRGRGTTERRPGMTAIGFYLRPGSRGVVSVQSSDPDKPPMVTSNWFSVPEDKARFLALSKALRRVMSQAELAPYIVRETVPGPEHASDEALFQASRRLLASGLHGTGTCSMGLAGASVVDDRLRVHGIRGLRVVDCSVMPPISGNTNGPTMAFAWRAAEIIQNDAAEVSGSRAQERAAPEQLVRS